MDHVSTKMKRSTRFNIRKHKGMYDSNFYKNMTKRETTIFETDAHR